eukprot:CAMPEP_0174819646 /NCGR_PEP_ID=MMETSP1107-20130205/3005_1 /TAXON_ID=36770 /ORGANISM="Paraphysomonas vestita, Strain GFlagA" /LENGTH=448 /DNA_ID=CAMNT_0016033537 /DNA_START=147 /DNA_END=1493 /DNA_ORIENTATION=+
MTKTFYTTNNSPSKSSTLNHHPSFHSHRRVRSMPSNELNMLDLFQPLGPSIIDNTPVLPTIPQAPSHDHADVLDMLPALGSMSMDAFDIFKVTSEDWIDNWKDFNQEENSPDPRTQVNTLNNQLKSNYTNSKAQSLSSLKSFNSVSPSSSGEFNTMLQQAATTSTYNQTLHTATPFQNQSQIQIQSNQNIIQKHLKTEFNLNGENPEELIRSEAIQQTTVFQNSSRPLGVASFQQHQQHQQQQQQLHQQYQHHHHQQQQQQQQYLAGNYSQQVPLYQDMNIAENKGHRRSHTTGRISGQDIFDDSEDTSFGIPPTSNYQQCYPINTKLNSNYQIRNSNPNEQPSTMLPPTNNISDSEYHVGKSVLRSSTTEDLDNLQLKNSRGKYRCGLCGQLKANHQCPYMIEIPTRSIATQVDPPYTDPNVPTSHPFYSGRCITVRSANKTTSTTA